MLDRIGVAARRRQPVMERDVGLGEVGDEHPVEPNQTLAVV